MPFLSKSGTSTESYKIVYWLLSSVTHILSMIHIIGLIYVLVYDLSFYILFGVF